MMAGTIHSRRILFAGAFAAALLTAGAAAVADAGHGHTAAIGEPGMKAKATRTVTITIRDNTYEPESIDVKKGETIRFVVKNTSELLHEFNIGTAAMHAEHQKEMAVMAEHGMITATGINRDLMNMDHSKMGLPVMKHDDPNAVLVEPGKTAELVWKFSKTAKLEFACNLPGHYEAGMVGQIHFGK
jgi:uncharacterized cupredoxin-like copper-binding protein